MKYMRYLKKKKENKIFVLSFYPNKIKDDDIYV